MQKIQLRTIKSIETRQQIFAKNMEQILEAIVQKRKDLKKFCKKKELKFLIKRGGKQMKRKLDTNKIYNFIGRAVVYSSLYIAAVGFTVWGFLQGMTYQEGKMEIKCTVQELR